MKGVIVSLALVFGALYVGTVYFPKKKAARTEYTNVDSLNYVIDSIKNDAFIYMTNEKRYEIALERLREEDSVAAQKFEDALYNIE